jgi:hypothetical protein
MLIHARKRSNTLTSDSIPGINHTQSSQCIIIYHEYLSDLWLLLLDINPQAKDTLSLMVECQFATSTSEAAVLLNTFIALGCVELTHFEDDEGRPRACYRFKV